MTIQTLLIVGSGQMGRGIAQVAAQTGHRVLLYDLKEQALNMAMEFIKGQLNKGAEKGKWSASDAATALAAIKPVQSLKNVGPVDLAVEAATENKSVKLEIFRTLDLEMGPNTLLASNTSSISITEIAAVTKRPDKVIGMHFMNPVPVMKLVEGIRGLETSDQTFQSVKACAEKMGKTFITARDYPGFAVNRILMPMINEACYALFEGVAAAEDIDQAMKLGTNQPMGPFELADFIGLDTCLAIMEVLHQGLGDTKYRPCPLLKQYVAAGRMGRKSGKGFYSYASK